MVEHREWLRKKWERKRKMREQINKDKNRRGKSPIEGDIMYGTHTGEYEKGRQSTLKGNTQQWLQKLVIGCLEM